MYMIAPILAHFCAIGTKCKFTAKNSVTKRKIHLFFTKNKKKSNFYQFPRKIGDSCHGGLEVVHDIYGLAGGGDGNFRTCA